jgi:hypothetical protein
MDPDPGGQLITDLASLLWPLKKFKEEENQKNYIKY